MRRAAAVVLGTVTGTALMVGAKLGSSGMDAAGADDTGTAVVVGGPDVSTPPTSTGKPKPAGTPTTPAPGGSGGPTPTGKPTASKPHPTPTPTHSGPADGTYSASAAVRGGRFGTLSMTVTVSGHRITAISASENGGEQQCYRSACPKLTTEALAAQSANINSVSGATYTSAAYRSSLQAILDRANG